MPRRMRCFRRKVTQASLSREGDRVSGGRSFLGIELLNFILHAYSSTRLRREPPRGGSLSLNPTFRLQKHHKSVVGITPYGCLLQWEKVPSLPRRMRCFRRNVIQASLSREGDRVSGGRSFSWHRVIKFYTARVLLQSHIRSTASRCGSVTLRL